MKRNFVSNDLEINSWKDINSYYEDLENRNINSIEGLLNWMHDRSEIESILEEDLAWRYIKMNCDTENDSFADRFNSFISTIEPNVNKYSNILDKKFIESEYIKQLDEKKYSIVIRAIKKNIELFREKNIEIIAEVTKLEQKYGVVSSKMTVEYDNKVMTLQQAYNYLKNTNREIRKSVYNLINNRRLEDKKELNNLFDKLIELRNIISKNAGYENFRDYKFDDLGRFDYTKEECFDFHESIKTYVVPLVKDIHLKRKNSLQISELKPWDLDVDAELKPALKPFENTDDLINKTIKCFNKVKDGFGNYLKIMKDNGYIDLDSRLGKAPGGFNYPLYESNIPFIFMNATGNLRDLETMVHEGGHAIHSFLSKDIKLVNFKELPSEVAELASMAMELISMEHWQVFFDSEEDYLRAKKSQLEGIIKILPWIALVDKFQHWVYTNPKHSYTERENAWNKISSEFETEIIDWTNQDEIYNNIWQKQLHIFEVPFYYIEYGIAQLGAIAIWKNYKENPTKAIEDYENALKLAYTKTIPEIYEEAGIRFDFKKDYIKELMDFVKKELSLI